MNKTQYLILSAAALCSVDLCAIEFKALASGGFDSNPLKLSDAFSPDQEAYLLGELYSESSLFDMVYWDFKARKFQYNGDPRADKLDLDFDLRFASDFTLGEQPFNYYLGLDYRHQDQTFVSRQTGAVATFQGVSLADRFDYDRDGYYLGLEYPSSETFTYYLEIAQQQTYYTDYDIPLLDNLDNKSQRVTLGVKLATENPGYFYLNFSPEKRSYVDRRDRDMDGQRIADSNLVLHRYHVDAGYVYQPDTSTRWEYGFHYVNRTSDGTQFYEAQRASIEIDARYRLADYHFLSANLSYQSFYYDKNWDQPMEFFEQDEIEQRGFRLKFEYAWILATLFETNLGFFTNLEMNAYDSPDDLFDYQQYQVNLGIRWSMD